MALRAVSARSALRASLSARAEALSLGPGWNAAALYALEDRGYAHSAADAERHQAVLAARAGQVVKNLDGQDGACGPDGVSQGHCSAYRVHLLLGHLERTLEVPEEKMNPVGGAVALGHPIGATGAVLTVKILHHLARTGGSTAW